MLKIPVTLNLLVRGRIPASPKVVSGTSTLTISPTFTSNWNASISPIIIPYFSSLSEFQEPSIILELTIETFCSKIESTPKI